MKSRRLEAIRAIVARETVQNQDELQKLLVAQGFSVTQATLSRDLRELGIVKSHDPERGGYCYVDSRGGKILPIDPHRNRFTVETIKSVEFSGCQGIIKTYPGFAGAVASVIDDNILATSRNMNFYVEMDSIEYLGAVVNCVKEREIRIYDVDLGKVEQNGERHVRGLFSVKLPKRGPHTELLAKIATLDGIVAIEEI